MPKLWAELDRQAHAIFGAAPFKLTWPIVLLLSAVAGIAEEIVFRGALQGWLDTLMPLWLAIILQAVIFAALHPVSRAYMAYVLLIGIVLGALYAWSGNLLAPMIAHFAYDVWALRRLYRQPVPASGEVEADA
nr:CPBP family intramembrane metalloprotease [Sphingomicrobium sediminis]